MKKILKLMAIPAAILLLSACGNAENPSNTSIPSGINTTTSPVVTTTTQSDLTTTTDVTPTTTSTQDDVTPTTTSTQSEITPTTTSTQSEITPTTTSTQSEITPTTTSTTIIPVVKDDDQININVVDKEYNGEAIEVNSTSISNRVATLEYKLSSEDDSMYTSIAPKEIGEYTVRATIAEDEQYNEAIATKDFKISYENITDYTQFENTDAYRVVTTPKEFLDAIYDAKSVYTTYANSTIISDGYVVRNNVRKNATNWTNAITKGLYLKQGNEYIKIPADTPFDANDETYTASMTYYEDSPCSVVATKQDIISEGTVKVIEIAADLDLGYNKIKNLGAASVFENWDKNKRLEGNTDVYADPNLKEAGISKINISNITNLVIYSKNCSKIIHAGFSVSSCKNVTFRNLDMDEIWMWEDSTSTSPTIKVGDYDSFGWAYFKVALSENITVDHCTFGKSFDGQIDYSQPFYQSSGTYSRAPLGGSGENMLTISYCNFKAGDDDEEGYLYTMMDNIEKEYQIYQADKTNYTYSNKSCRYYFTLRDKGLSFDEVLYGIAIPQKKAFLWGDENEYYLYNKHLNVVMYGCKIKNIEDRLPKVRGGMAYVYNVEVDNTEYLPYVSILKNVQSAVQSANSKYKLGAVSQGIIAGLDASVYLESVIINGISSYIKNNESMSSQDMAKWGIPSINGGYMIKNSIIGGISGSTDKTTNTDPFKSLNSTTSSLSIANFAFKVNGEKTDLTEPPFEIDAYDISMSNSLDEYFSVHKVGIYNNSDTEYWLNIN